MNRHYEGNAARKMNPDSLPYNDPRPDIPALEERERKKAERRRRLEYDSSLRDAYKLAGKARLRMAARLLAVFAALIAVSGLIAWRSAKITEMSFYNAGLRRQIGEYSKQNSLLRDDISGKTSLASVEKQAVKVLGMQKMTPDAMIHVGIQNELSRYEALNAAAFGAASGRSNDNAAVVKR